jgi:alpha-mannosidase
MLSDITVLFPCHSLDDFPTHHQGALAEGLLSAWTAAWHPQLLAALGKTPTWHRADEPPEDCSGRLLIVPKVSADELPDGFADRARQRGAILVDSVPQRKSLIDELLRVSATSPPNGSLPNTVSALAEDFLALGFCYLQTEVLTRRMRYASHLDESKFQESALAAARAWVIGDEEQTKSQLAICFDALVEAKSQFYAVDSYLIDVTLVSASTIGAALREELTSGTPRNVLISAETLSQLATQEPQTLQALRNSVEQGTTSIIGGLSREIELPLLSHEAILSQLQSALPIYEQIFGRRPTVFGSRRFALTPALPQILREIGFTAALHVSFDEGVCPTADHTKTRWQGLDGSAIDALARPPLDAGRSDSFLALPEELNRTMDHDFVATVVMAHWPGYGSPFYHDLRRMAAYAPLLGKFVTVDEYFRETSPPGVYSKFMPDQYRTPYLVQAAATAGADPISLPAKLSEQQAKTQAAEAVTSLTALASGKMPVADAGRGECSNDTDCAAFAAVLPRTDGPNQSRLLLVNPLSFTRQIGVDTSKEIKNVESSARGIVEVPPLGFTFFTADDLVTGKQSVAQSGPIVQSDNRLVNEFCEVTIHPETGGIRSIRDFHSRGNRLSQQVGIRLPASQPPAAASDTADESLYSTIAVESIQTVQNDALFGKVVSHARLLDAQGKQLARLNQSISLWRGSRVVVLEIEIADCSVELPADPWSSYIACRFAWPGDAATLRRSVHSCIIETKSKRLEAPQFVEVAGNNVRTTILTAGLPYHRRSGTRMLDCLLRTRGETSSTFRLGIGIDVPHPWRAAQEIISPPQVIAEDAPPPASGSTGWFFHVDRPNVAITYCSPLLEAGRVTGFRLRLLECEGRRGQLKLRSFRTPASARRVDLSGTLVSDLVIDGEAIAIDFGPYEWIQVEAAW